jgi:hypothetical protein
VASESKSGERVESLLGMVSDLRLRSVSQVINDWYAELRWVSHGKDLQEVTTGKPRVTNGKPR